MKLVAVVDFTSEMDAEFVVAWDSFEFTEPLGPVPEAEAVLTFDPEVALTGPTTHDEDSPGAKLVLPNAHGVTRSGSAGSEMEMLEIDASPELVTRNL